MHRKTEQAMPRRVLSKTRRLGIG